LEIIQEGAGRPGEEFWLNEKRGSRFCLQIQSKTSRNMAATAAFFVSVKGYQGLAECYLYVTFFVLLIFAMAVND
jgi:hypothetical protein